jgi:hypothetical protein
MGPGHVNLHVVMHIDTLYFYLTLYLQFMMGKLYSSRARNIPLFVLETHPTIQLSCAKS